jgi:hypothetical protein
MAMPSPRPNLQTYLDAHPHDLPRAVEAYRAALHAYDFARTVEASRGPAVPWRSLAVGLGLIVVALLLMRALAGCSAADPGDCAAACHDGQPEGSRALLDCVAACSSLDADPTHHGDPRP